MNLESMNCDLDEIIHEAQLMKNYNHGNVLPLHTSFVAGQDLWMVMPFISGGSVLHIIKYAHPEVRHNAWKGECENILSVVVILRLCLHASGP